MRKPLLKLCLRHNASSDKWIAQHNLKYYSNAALFCSFKLFSVRIVTAIETDFVSQPSLIFYQWKFHNRKMLDSDWSTYLFTQNLFGEFRKAAFWLVDGMLTISTSRQREFPKWLKQYYDIFMKHFGNSFTPSNKVEKINYFSTFLGLIFIEITRGPLKGESVVMVILLSRMEVSYCISWIFFVHWHKSCAHLGKTCGHDIVHRLGGMNAPNQALYVTIEIL